MDVHRCHCHCHCNFVYATQPLKLCIQLLVILTFLLGLGNGENQDYITRANKPEENWKFETAPIYLVVIHCWPINNLKLNVLMKITFLVINLNTLISGLWKSYLSENLFNTEINGSWLRLLRTCFGLLFLVYRYTLTAMFLKYTDTHVGF